MTLTQTLMLIAGVLLTVGDAGSAERATPPRGLWQQLVVAGSRWTLRNPNGEVVVEVKEVRSVGGVTAARLACTITSDGRARSCDGGELPSTVAVGKGGIFLLHGKDGDKDVATALRGKPDLADPPRLHDSDQPGGQYVTFFDDGGRRLLCFGRNPPAHLHAESAFREVCLAPGAGLVRLTSDGGIFALRFAEGDGEGRGAFTRQ